MNTSSACSGVIAIPESALLRIGVKSYCSDQFGVLGRVVVCKAPGEERADRPQEKEKQSISC